MRRVCVQPRTTPPFFWAILALALLGPLSGCRKQEAALAPPPPKPKAPPQISEADLKSHKPNEAGAMMILMYHRINPNEPNNDLNRTPDQFRKDLETLYKKKYHPVTVSELVDNRMEVPAGKTPVVLTFDDSLPTQFKIVTGADGQPHIDPDCAVGIMETFHKSHPDWPTKATFFVLPKEGRSGEPFGQVDSAADKFAYLIENGYEIANHSSTHSSLRRMAADKIQWELATAVKSIREIEPKAEMRSFALPYGHLPRKGLEKYLRSGESGGTGYENKAVLRAAWRPVRSPITRNDPKLSEAGTLCVFDPYRLERMRPDPRPNQGQTYEYWLKYFDENPGLRYVSDGNPEVVAVPKSQKAVVDAARVKAQGKILQLYSFASSEGGQGASLSVESKTR